MFTNKTYDFLKWIAQILLPALGTLYFALARIWNLPYAEQIVGTIVAVDTFLGVILGISTARYNAQFGAQSSFNVDITEEYTGEGIEDVSQNYIAEHDK